MITGFPYNKLCVYVWYDYRFSSLENKNALPLWVRDQAQVYDNFGQALKDVILFFKEAEKSVSENIDILKRSSEANAAIENIYVVWMNTVCLQITVIIYLRIHRVTG